MLEFKPEDFINATDNPMQTRCLKAADVANAKFQEWVKSLDVVYGALDDEFVLRSFHTYPSKTAPTWGTHQAFIFGIKEIETECEHLEILHRESYKDEWRCRDCGKKLRPTSWEVVE